MKITNENTVSYGIYNRLRTALLLGKTNTGCDEISIQITHVEPEGEQAIHQHPQNQCYFVISGNGMMIIEDEQCAVKNGDAIYIPGNSLHGIKNIGNKELIYLTANKSFDESVENFTWTNNPIQHEP